MTPRVEALLWLTRVLASDFLAASKDSGLRDEVRQMCYEKYECLTAITEEGWGAGPL